MDRIEEMPINRLLTEMAMKTFPSPKAGSSLALTLAMACALLELVIADRGEERAVPPGRDWHSDVLHVREWRRDALLLGEADMSEVIRLFRDHPGTAEANPLSSPTPVARLQALAETVMETGIPYLDHAGDKKATLSPSFYRRERYGWARIISDVTTGIKRWKPLLRRVSV